MIYNDFFSEKYKKGNIPCPLFLNFPKIVREQSCSTTIFQY